MNIKKTINSRFERDFSKKLQIDYYESFPVLSLKKTALNDPTVKIFKRLFDYFFGYCNHWSIVLTNFSNTN
jgi:hypothetical protein